MKKSILILTVASVSIISFCCNKTIDEPQLTPTGLLTSKTWIFDEVTDYELGAIPEVIYKRGSANNLADLSKVEHHFLPNGSFLYRNEQGINSSAKWKWLDDSTRLEITPYSMGKSLILTEVSFFRLFFTYKVNEGQHYSIYKCVPKP